MANIFTRGLIEKRMKILNRPPRDLLHTLNNLLNWPNSLRVSREAVYVARKILYYYVRPFCLTRRAVVSFGHFPEYDDWAVEYQKLPREKTRNSRGYSDQYSFHMKEPRMEFCITRERTFGLDETTGEYFYFRLKPVCLEIIENSNVLECHSFRNPDSDLVRF